MTCGLLCGWRGQVLVLLLSKGLLSRPWVLLEINHAVSLKKPIVLLELRGPGQTFSFDDALAMLDDLETSLSMLNSTAVDELHARLVPAADHQPWDQRRNS